MPTAEQVRVRPRPSVSPAGPRGRAAELRVVDERLAAVRAGRGGVLLLDGPPGIGKTRLVTELHARAARGGLPVLRAGAGDGQQSLPYATLLAATVGACPPVGDPRAVRDLGGYWLVHHLSDALGRAAAGTGLVITLDDLQWADAGTITAVRLLAGRLRAAPVLWVLAARRDQAGSAVRDLFAHLTDHGADVLRLGPLPSPVVPAVIEDHLRATALPPLLDLAGAAGGDPYWLIELLRGLSAEGRIRLSGGHATVAGDEMPRRVVRLMRERLDTLTPATRRVLRMAAVLPERFTAEQLAGLLRGRPSDLIDPLHEAIRAGLLVADRVGLRFRPDLARQATREALPRTLRRALEREATDVLLRTGAAPADVAAVLADTAGAGDRQAVATLREAARTIAAADPAAAAGLCARAFDLLDADDPDRGPTAGEAAGLLYRSGRPDDARDLADRALAGLLTTQQEADLRLALSTMAGRGTAARLRDNRISLALPAVDPGTLTGHRAQLAHNLLMAGDVTAAQRLARTEDHPASDVVRVVTAVAHTALGAGAEASAAIDELIGTGREVTDPYAAVVLSCLGREPQATVAMNACRRRAARDHDHPLVSLTTQLAGTVHLAAGRLAEARADAGPAAPAGDDDLGAAVWMVTTAVLAVHLGDKDMAHAAAATAKRLRGGGITEHRWSGRVLALAAAGRDDPAHACRLLADDPLLPSSPPLPVDIAVLITAARVAVAAGDQALIDRVTGVAGTLTAEPAVAPAFAAGAEHLRGLLHSDPDRLLTAAGMHASAGRPLLAAAATEDAARIRHSAEHLHSALRACTDAGASGDAQRISRLLREWGVVRRVAAHRPGNGWDSLTDAELRVVRLIAAGVTNRAAAERLFISPHTVSTHVRNAFAKLGLTSRVQLANVLRDNGG